MLMLDNGSILSFLYSFFLIFSILVYFCSSNKCFNFSYFSFFYFHVSFKLFYKHTDMLESGTSWYVGKSPLNTLLCYTIAARDG
jgi:hypothetical protein